MMFSILQHFTHKADLLIALIAMVTVQNLCKTELMLSSWKHEKKQNSQFPFMKDLSDLLNNKKSDQVFWSEQPAMLQPPQSSAAVQWMS